MNKRLQKLMAERARVRSAMDALNATADAESNGILAGDALAKYTEHETLLAQIDESIAREKRLIDADRNAPAATVPNAPVVADVHNRAADQPFATLGEQLQAIADVGMRRADSDTIERLAAVSGASANVGADGGFLIQKDHATELLESAFGQNEVLSACDTTEIGPDSDGLEVVYLDETSRATGSRWGGIRVYRGAEADSATAQKPQLGRWECRLEDIIGLAYATERLLRDASALGDVFSKGFNEEIGFKCVDEIVRGTGAGQMLGIVNADCTVSVAKETGQAADTFLAENAQKMWKSVHPRSRPRGAWYYNTELEDQLQNMQIGTGTSAQLVYMPPGGLSGAPYGTLYGRPVIPIEQASGAGDVGDIFFADFSRYKVIRKDGVQQADSIHVRFNNNERTFRWVARINGAPKDKSAITPYKRTDSNYKVSAFVTLAAR